MAELLAVLVVAACHLAATNERDLATMKSALDISDLEHPDCTVVELVICWGDDVLYTEYLASPRRFCVGDPEQAAEVDYTIPSEILGTTRLPLVVAATGFVAAVVPANATGSIELPEQGTLELEKAREAGLFEPCEALPGSWQTRLPKDGRTHMAVNGFVFHVAVVPAPRRMPRVRPSISCAGLCATAGTLALHVGIMIALIWLSDNISVLTSEIDPVTYAYQLQLLQGAERRHAAIENTASTRWRLEAQAFVTEQRPPRWGDKWSSPPDPEQETFDMFVPGSDTLTPHDRTRREIQQLGVRGALAAIFACFGRDVWGEVSEWNCSERALLSAFAPLSTVIGGDAWGDEIGTGPIGGLSTNLNEQARSTYHRWAVPAARVRVAPGGVYIAGMLPKETIRRIVRANFPRFRACYQHALKGSPKLRGVVTARFVIDATGAVASWPRVTSTMADDTLPTCVCGVFHTLSFPEPEVGQVQVSFALEFFTERL